MRIERGEVVAVLGSNGVGKNYTEQCDFRLHQPSAGSISFKGETLTGRKPRDVVAAGIAHVPEGRKIFPNLSVADNLRLGAFRRASNNVKQNFERICAIFRA